MESTLWVVIRQGDDPRNALILYALAEECGLSWRGCATKRRKHYSSALPKRTSLVRLARRLGMHRHTIAAGLKRLWATGFLELKGRRIEPVAHKLFARSREASPADRFKLPARLAADPTLNISDKMVLGKLEKCASQHGKRWAPKAWQLALDITSRCLETIRRSLRKLQRLGMLSKTVVDGWHGYVSSSFYSLTRVEDGLEDRRSELGGLISGLVAGATDRTVCVVDPIAVLRSRQAVDRGRARGKLCR